MKLIKHFLFQDDFTLAASFYDQRSGKLNFLHASSFLLRFQISQKKKV